MEELGDDAAAQPLDGLDLALREVRELRVGALELGRADGVGLALELRDGGDGAEGRDPGAEGLLLLLEELLGLDDLAAPLRRVALDDGLEAVDVVISNL